MSKAGFVNERSTYLIQLLQPLKGDCRDLKIRKWWTLNLPSLKVMTRAGLEKGEQAPGDTPQALNLTSYPDQGFRRLAMYMTSTPEYSSSVSMNSS